MLRLGFGMVMDRVRESFVTNKVKNPLPAITIWFRWEGGGVIFSGFLGVTVWVSYLCTASIANLLALS